jgi:dihydroorotate dehydrogenase electron transfer subunit
MAKTLEQCEVIHREQIQEDLVFLHCYAPNISKSAIPGQFVHIRPSSGELPILRRPYSLFDVRKEAIELLVAVVGRGSAMIANTQVGQTLDMLGPLGNGFPDAPATLPPIYIAGGVGIAPLHFLWRHWNSKEIQGEFLLGASTKSRIPLPKDSPLWKKARIATDDGSYGFHGTVVQLFQNIIDQNNRSWNQLGMVFVCGPVPMIRSLVPILTLNRLSGMVSLEQTMGCGVGACQGCAVATANHMDSDYLLTCQDGPVFKIEDVNLDYLTDYKR